MRISSETLEKWRQTEIQMCAAEYRYWSVPRYWPIVHVSIDDIAEMSSDGTRPPDFMRDELSDGIANHVEANAIPFVEGAGVKRFLNDNSIIKL